MGLKKESTRGTPPDIRAAAVEMVEKGGKLREVAQAFKVSHETVRQWAKDARAERQAAPADKPARAKGATGPVYVGGQRLGRLGVVEMIAAQRACHGAGVEVSGPRG